MKRRRRFLAGVLAILLAGGVVWWLCQPKMESLAEKVQVGMTQAQVEAIMGHAQLIENSGRRLVWFDGTLNTIGMGVDFDAEGQVFYKTPVQRVSAFNYLIYNLGMWRTAPPIFPQRREFQR
jgi:hypothetical protein